MDAAFEMFTILRGRYVHKQIQVQMIRAMHKSSLVVLKELKPKTFK